MAIDHLVLAARDLDRTVAWFESATGVRATPGGAHPGRGTRNALVSCGEKLYLELLATDPAQPLAGTFGENLLRFESPAMHAYMLRSTRLEALQSIYREHGVDARLSQASRCLPDGRTLNWRLLIPEPHEWGDCLPKYIDWGNTPHPSTSAKSGCTLSAFEVIHPQAAKMARLWHAIGCEIVLVEASRPGLRAQLQTPNGPLTLESGERVIW
ncbi:MAG: VOC family protein [Betaproteobacteria bacterium]|nr:VOC family protein [Betaproteobacteria bacterium]